MPPSSVYIGRTTEKRSRGNGTVWFWALAVTLVVAAAIVLATS